MKVLIVSDTHRKETNFERVIEIEKNIDMLIHLGDIEGAEDYIRSIVNCPCYMVAGNNDYFSMLHRDLIIDIGPYKALLTHGHHYYVSLGYETIKSEAIAQGVDIVMFGHTHRPSVDVENEITLLNPGSLTYPRQENRKPSYIVMTIDDENQAHYEIKYLG